jgi:hypothetical protein
VPNRRPPPPQYLADYVAGGQPPQLDALSIQAYYTWRLATSARMRLEIAKDGGPTERPSAKSQA